MTDQSLDLAKTAYQSGKLAFERGFYQQSVQYLEKASALVNAQGILGGEMQVWLVVAYEAAGQQEQAIALCQQLKTHPDLETRKQSRRLLSILEAPRLVSRPEWMTQIPDLAQLDDNSLANAYIMPKPRRKPAKPKPYEPEAIDWTQVNREDNRFVWVALAIAGLVLGGLAWWGA